MREEEKWWASVIPSHRVVIIGAGPAGLTAAHELLVYGKYHVPIVFESTGQVGGISRTEEYKGYRFDIGGHRFFTKVNEINRLWAGMLGSDFIKVKRASRIYYRGRFFEYPLQIYNALRNMGVYESVRIALSLTKWKVRPHRKEDTFEQWVINRFGGRLYWHFFRTYTEKVWGVPGREIRADWAAQRIKDLSLVKTVWKAFTGAGSSTSLINEFMYPRLGPGMMWERFEEILNADRKTVVRDARVTRLCRDGDKVVSVQVEREGVARAESFSVEIGHVISSMPLSELVLCIKPAAPPDVVAAAKLLKHRDFLIVTLILDHADPFPDNWIYVHSPDVKVGRIQNFRAWSEDMVPEAKRSSIGMEYFCHEGDGLWDMQNACLIKMASAELEKLGLAPISSVVDGTVIRQPKAYPVYDKDYQRNVNVIRKWLSTFKNLQAVGRNGMHRYNNQDHSMLTAMLAVKNILGEKHDLWEVNLERSYSEEFSMGEKVPAEQI